MKPISSVFVALAVSMALAGCNKGAGTGNGDVDTDADTDSDTDTDTDSDTDSDTDTDTDIDTTTDPIADLEVTCEIEQLDVEGEVDPPENNVSAVVWCSFENVGSVTIDLADAFPGDLKSHPAEELLDSEIYLSETYWDGTILPEETASNTYARSEDGAHVGNMYSSDLFVIVLTIVDENGHTLEVTTPPAEAGWGA